MTLPSTLLSTLTRELFGAFLQVVTTFKEGELPLVLEVLNKMQNHLTAGVVSNDNHFLHEVLGNTINGTIYALSVIHI